MTVEYFEFYHGTLMGGFTYIYGKRTVDHSFVLFVPGGVDGVDEDITDPIFDFESDKELPDFLKRYADMWRPVKFQWQGLENQFNSFLESWQATYQAPAEATENLEWGLRLKIVEENEERRYAGFNRYPINFDEFMTWLTQFAGGKLR